MQPTNGIQIAALGGFAKSPIKGRAVVRAPCRINGRNATQPNTPADWTTLCGVMRPQPLYTLSD